MIYFCMCGGTPLASVLILIVCIIFAVANGTRGRGPSGVLIGTADGLRLV